MSKVDLEKIRELDQRSKELMDEYLKVRGQIVDEGLFCDICGEKNPPEGFYPLGMSGPNTISGVQCNPCRREILNASS